MSWPRQTAPTAEWAMINDAASIQPSRCKCSGQLALFIAWMAFNLVGDALRRSIRPHLRRKARTPMPQQIELRNIALVPRAATRCIVNPATRACWR